MGCISFLVKNLVFVVNFVFAVAGLALLILGCVFKFAYVNKLSTDTVPSALNVVSILVIIVGSLVFVTSFLGCCGAIRNSVCMLRLYAAILLAFFIIQLTIGVYAFVKIKDSDFKNDVNEALGKTFHKYYSSSQYKDAIDTLQQSMECCGVNGAISWDGRIPSSCCADNSNPCSKSSKDIFTKGCSDELFSFLDVAFRVLGHVIIAIGAAEYAAILLAFFIIQLTIGVYAFVKIKDSDFKNDVNEALGKTFHKYYSSSQYKDAIDTLQQSMECCGVNGAISWDGRIPSSCCADNSNPCSKSSKDIFTKGCSDELFSFLDVAFRVLGHVIIAIGAAELLGAIFGCYLSGNIARKMRERY